MKKQLSFLLTLSLGILLLFSGAIRLDAQTIIFLTDDNNEAYTVEFLQDQGLNVTTMWPGAHISTWDPADIATLNAANLIIAGRSINSGEWSDSLDRVAWNNLTAPVLQLSPYAVRNSRNNWFNSGSAIAVDPGAVATAIVPGDVVFDNVTLDGSNQMIWFPYRSNALLHTATDNNGTVIASIGDTIPLLVRWPLTGEPYYVAGPDTAASERVYFGFGIEAYDDLTPQATHFPLTRDAKQVFLAEICRILGIAQQVAVFDKPYHFDILFLRDITNTKDDYTINFLANQGFKVHPFWGDGDVNTWGPDTLQMLNDADLVISGRSVNSGNFQDSIERVVWNNITAPMMYNSPYHVRNNRNNLFNSGSAIDLGLTDEAAATAVIPGDVIFDDVTLDGSNMLPWFRVNSNAIMDNSGANNGTVVAQLNDTVPLIVRWDDPTEPFYPGGPDTAVAERVYFGFGIEPDEPHHFPLTTEAKQVFLAEICRMIGISSSAAVYSPTDFTITFVNEYAADNNKDSTQRKWLNAQGFVVNDFRPAGVISTWSQDTLDILNKADIIIVGRSIGSTDTQNREDLNIWDSLTVPVLFNSPWACRNTRNNFFNSTGTASFTGDTEADAIIADDPVLEFATITDGKMDWFVNNGDYIKDVSGSNQGTVVVAQGDSIPFLVRFEPNKAFYAAGPDSALAERVYFGFGMEDGQNYFPLTQSTQSVYFAEIMRILGGKITAPSTLFGVENKLSFLETDKGTMTPDFDADVTSYAVTVVLGTDDSPIEVTALAGGDVTITGAGTYNYPADNSNFNISVVATSQVGQSTTYTIAVTIDKTIDVEEYTLDEGYSIYPNPFSNTITINSSEVITNVAVYNLQGAMILSSVVNDNTAELDLSTLKSGAYIIKVNNYTKTIIKQ